MASPETWIGIARRPDIVLRSLRVALLVGTILVGINYGDRILDGNLTGGDGIKMLMTFFVPYGVSTYASVGAVMSGKG
ncbi:MAG: nitrate/nitrite transporter NrtS [Gammaproteobacteria bacterium]